MATPAPQTAKTFDGKTLEWWLMLLAGLIPLLVLAYDAATDQLGANPIQALHIRLGDFALRFLCLSLLLTPLKQVCNWRWALRYRRMIGLYAFFYASLHVLVYLGLDHGFRWRQILLDIRESPYVIAGLVAFVCLLPLAITSTQAWQKRLGRDWKRLHRLVYLAAIAAVIHYFWMLKGNLIEPLFYALIIGILLAFRVAKVFKEP